MGNLYSSLTFRLFKKRGVSPFLEGMSSIVLNNVSSEETYNYDATDFEADTNSIRADWMQVGNDLRSAMHEHEHTSEQATSE